MKKISYWAKNNVWQTRGLIIISYFLIAFFGNLTGEILLSENIILSKIYLYVLFTISCLIFTLYPSQKKDNYNLRKSLDFLLIFSFFFLVLFSANQKSVLPIYGNLFASSIIIPHDTVATLNSNPHITSFIEKINKAEKEEISIKGKRKILKNQIKEIKGDKDLSKNEKTGLIIVSMMVALLLMMGVALVACNIACAGSGTAALLVLLGGWFLTLFFFARTVNYISKGPRKRVLMKRQEGMKKTTDSPT